MEMHQLRYFVAVAEARSFSRAAEACFVSQPSLSQQIAKLEESAAVSAKALCSIGLADACANRRGPVAWNRPRRSWGWPKTPSGACARTAISRAAGSPSGDPDHRPLCSGVIEPSKNTSTWVGPCMGMRRRPARRRQHRRIGPRGSGPADRGRPPGAGAVLDRRPLVVALPRSHRLIRKEAAGDG